MRIDSMNQVSQVYNMNKIRKVNTSYQASFSDKVEISQLGKDIQIAKQAVKEAPDVREDVTAPIKAAIQNGTYDVSGEDFADKLLAKLSESFG